MSGICSEHQGHEPSCPRCTAVRWPSACCLNGGCQSGCQIFLRDARIAELEDALRLSDISVRAALEVANKYSARIAELEAEVADHVARAWWPKRQAEMYQHIAELEARVEVELGLRKAAYERIAELEAENDLTREALRQGAQRVEAWHGRIAKLEAEKREILDTLAQYSEQDNWVKTLDARDARITELEALLREAIPLVRQNLTMGDDVSDRIDAALGAGK